MTRRTIDGFALRKVVVLLACQEGVPVSSNNTLDVAARDVEEETLGHVGSTVDERVESNKVMIPSRWGLML